MQAVVECITEDAPPPKELELAWQCERWHTLPGAGGLLDQEHRIMFLMTALSNIYDAVNRARTLKGKDIHRLTESERKILRLLMDNRILFHA